MSSRPSKIARWGWSLLEFVLIWTGIVAVLWLIYHVPEATAAWRWVNDLP